MMLWAHSWKQRAITLSIMAALISSLLIITDVDAGRGKIIYWALKSVQETVTGWMKTKPANIFNGNSIRQGIKKLKNERDADKVKGFIQDQFKKAGPKAGKALALLPSSLSINTEPADAQVRVMNIKSKYRPNMRLSPGDYHIEVTKTGYRSRNFWINIDKKAIPESGLIKVSQHNYDVALNPKGVANCVENLEIRSMGTLFDEDGQIFNHRLLIENATVSEIFTSFADTYEGNQFSRILNSSFSDDMAFLEIIQANNLSAADIKNNKEAEIDPDRALYITVAFEQQGNDVQLVQQFNTPSGSAVRDVGKSFFCEDTYNKL